MNNMDIINTIEEIINSKLEMLSLEECKRLDMSDNNKKNFYTCDRNNNCINNLKISNLNIKKLDKVDVIQELRDLESLDISSNDLTTLPKWIENLESLRSLNISSNELTKLPDCIEKLKNLETLNLSSNNLTTLPKWFENFENLKNLNISSNKFTKLPNCIVNLKNLESINSSSNNLTTLPEWFENLENLKTLHLGSNKVTTLPDCVVQLKNLKTLNLDSNGITVFPDCISKLKKLKGLILSSNQLTILPNHIMKLKMLELLDLSFNQLTILPEFSNPIKKLFMLNLSGNQLTDLPKWIGDQKNLVILLLTNNNLTKIPEYVSELKKLIIIDLSNNQITSIPNSIGKLKRLRTLVLAHNKLVEFPDSCKNIPNVYLEGNDTLLSPPPSVVAMGTDAIRSYFNNDMEQVYASKVVVVGEGGMGKTCLLDSLEGKKFNSDSSSTHGIEIREIEMKHPELNNIIMQLNIWDFGGQDIYHATHQFYLTNYSLFVLVWSARQGYEASKIYKWLETINALAPNSPILIVATNSKERGADLPKGDISQKYGDKITFCQVDNSNGQGIEELKEAIRLSASKLKYMGICRPKSWIKAKNKISELSNKYLSQKELFEIFSNSGVENNSYESLGRYLHEMGDILYYYDDVELRDTVIIKPSWVSQHIAKVLDSEQVSLEAGFLKRSLLAELWKDLDFNLHQKFVRLMEKYDLSYNVIDSEDEPRYLIVEKLKHEEHNKYQYEWQHFQGKNTITFKYKLDTIPAGIPTWFIARTHRFSILIHWRTGVLLVDDKKNPKHMGIVLADRESKEVWLKVQGEQPYYFFSILRDTLELTFKRFSGLVYTPYVPCKGHKNQSCTHFFKLEHLDKRILTNDKIYCPEGFEDVKIMEHIYGLSYSLENHDLAKLILDKINENHAELIKFFQLEFIKTYQIQQKLLDISCPNLFTLTPLEHNWLLKDILANEFELQLYCQKPGCVHPVEKGKYTLKIPKSLVKSFVKYYNKMVPILKKTLPVLAPGASAFLESIDLKDFDWITKSVGEAGKGLEKIIDENLDLENFKAGEGAEIRMLHELLVEIDKTRFWGGLERVATPEGHILWLCKEHKLEYQY